MALAKTAPWDDPNKSNYYYCEERTNKTSYTSSNDFNGTCLTMRRCMQRMGFHAEKDLAHGTIKPPKEAIPGKMRANHH